MMKFQLSDDWRWEQPKEESNWCQTCFWNGSWTDLLHRSNLKLVSRCCPLFNEAALRSSASDNLCCAVLWALYHKYIPSGQSGYITFNFDDELLVFNEHYQRLPPLGRLKIHTICSPHPESDSLPGLSSRFAELCPILETGSAESLLWAKSRIDICSSTHICHDFRSKDRTLPTRLIQIPRDPAKSDLRLRNSSDLRRGIKYVALSYCWGKKTSPCLTTSDNLATHLEAIPWSLIPQTFRDAVLFSRSLGVEYIWIDSICIIQGDDVNAKADWSRESARMFQYYSNAHVTLAAASSSDCHGGLFIKGPIEKSHLLDFAFRGHDYPLFVSETPSEVLDFTDAATGLGRDVENTYPLLSRAWAFQERLVSPRVIFFTKFQLIWDCYSGCVFEEDAARIAEYGLMLYQGLKQNYLKLLQQPSIMREGSTSGFEWNHVLKAYSHLQLSDPHDRLPAIAAIAEQILSRKYEDPAAEYLCGLRKSDLHIDLLWMPAAHSDSSSGRSGESESEAPYVAPSWSWASFPGQIMDTAHYEAYRSSTIHLVHDGLLFNESRRFSRVLGGHIVIEGPVVECIWNISNVDSEPALDKRPQILQVLPQRRVQDDATIKQLDKEHHIIEFIPDYDTAYEGLEGTLDPGQIAVSLLQTWNSTVHGRSGALALYQNKTTGTYRRLGARLRKRSSSDERLPWGLVDDKIFEGAKRRGLALE